MSLSSRDSSVPLPIADYEITEDLGQGPWHALRRARRRSDGATVLLKATYRRPPRAVDLDLLEREHTMLRSLSLEGVPRALALEHDDAGARLVLEDPGGVALAVIAARRPDLDTFFAVATRFASLLAELHRRNIVHQGITLRAILVDLPTSAVSLHDFGLACRTSGDAHLAVSFEALRDILPYLSPEQTGRMNRTVDYRTDFYSAGVTLYELLTGAPPFVSSDPLEIIHAHIARVPASPTATNAGIPAPVSAIVMKLLAKTVEERYQSALGLKEDLETCAAQWKSHRRIAPFSLGSRDVSDRFGLPQRLYGRQREVEELMAAFDRVREGSVEILLVAGSPGIGKTALVQELYRPIVRDRGYFVAGKFDQVVRDIPHGALTQAFRGLLRLLLAESEDRLTEWRTRLSAALGANARVLAEVIPEIELILGRQAPPIPVGPVESLNRFQLAFQKFVSVVAQPDHPLVVFLDDLQWADSATLALLGPLLASPDLRFLLLIGAYRDNEVDAAHTLTHTLNRLTSAGVGVRRVALGPLGLADLAHLVGDTLRWDPSDGRPLAEVVSTKTGGNPFFVLQFLKTLSEERLLEFDYAKARWTARLDAIAAAAITDNVVDLMTRRIERLGSRARHALTLGACIGSPFEASVLALVSEQSLDVVTADLQEAVEEGLILPVPSLPGYTFLHDRVQQAAYAGIPADRKPLVHLAVGRLLRQGSPAATEERLFDVAHHLNLGRALMTDPAEQLDLARLNLLAGRKAMSSTAYAAARGYFMTGLGLLGAEHWEADYDLMLGLTLHAAESAYLCGHFDEAERIGDELLGRARTHLDAARVYSLKILQYEHLSRYADAIRMGREALARFGVTVPESAEERRLRLDDELELIDKMLAERSIESLIALPVMTDPAIRAVMKLRATLHTSCFLSGDKVLTLLNTAAMVRLSLAHGNIEESAYAYTLYAAMLLGPLRGTYAAAYDFGTLALRLNERLWDPALRAKVLMMFAWSISLWRMPLEASLPHTREAFRLGNETGLFVDAAWALFNEIWFALLTCGNLSAFHQAYAANVDYSERVRMPHIADAGRILLQWGRALQGLTEHPLSLTDGSFDEQLYRTMYQGQRLFEMFHIVAKLSLLYTFEEPWLATETARSAEAIIREDFTGTIWDQLRVFHHALALAALRRNAAPPEREEIDATLDALHRKLEQWAVNSPHNFRAHELLVAAEIARARENDTGAAALYEAALTAAAADQRLRELALASELYARLWQARGQTAAAAVFMTRARDAYARWGAGAKVADLTRRYPDLLGHAAGDLPPVVALDVQTVMKASQAIAGEIELGRLLTTLLRIAIENAGADRGSLLLERDGELYLHAEGSLDAIDVNVSDAPNLSSAATLPRRVVNYVRRTCEGIVIADAMSDDRWATDPDVVRRQPRSILCTPVLHQGRLVGVLYLENNVTTHVFTADRLEVVQILASQAAISLDNARLYEDMKQEVTARRRAEQELRVALTEVESLKNRLQAENVYLREEIHRDHNFVEMVGNSAALLDVLRKVERVAPTDSTVLICGETGTGKELVARAIHSRSARRDRPLVKLNCTAISAGLVESELFGHVKGAFTGALDRRVGRFQLADGGTIFLDEVGELPLETQVKLLRVLQEREFEPVGSNQTIRVDVRLIAATNRDLAAEVHSGRFRADLFYRLNVFPIDVPALRSRTDDIPQLAMLFLTRFAKALGKPVNAVSTEAMDALLHYSWPGNIRELQNVIERAVILCPGSVLELASDIVLPGPAAAVTRHGPGRQAHAVAPVTEGGLSDMLESMERAQIAAALERSGGVIEGPRGAAQLLKIHPNTLRGRIEKLGLRRTIPEKS